MVQNEPLWLLTDELICQVVIRVATGGRWLEQWQLNVFAVGKLEDEVEGREYLGIGRSHQRLDKAVEDFKFHIVNVRDDVVWVIVRLDENLEKVRTDQGSVIRPR